MSRIPRRELRRRLGWQSTHLDAVLGGGVELKLEDLHAILHAIGWDATEFFARLEELSMQKAHDLEEEIVPGVSVGLLHQAVHNSLLRMGFKPFTLVGPAAPVDERDEE